MRIATLMIVCFIAVSCFVSNNEIILPGKIAVISNERVCAIYDNSITSAIEFTLRDDEHSTYDIISWVHNDDSFVGTESLNRDDGAIYKSNIVKFNLQGKIIEVIYESQDGELVGFPFLSRTDKKLIFTSETDLSSSDPLEVFGRPQSLVIMDFNDKKIVTKLENISPLGQLDIEESPWLVDEERFIFTLRSERKISLSEKNNKGQGSGVPGIYIYDLKTDKYDLLVRNGSFGVCSPVSLQIGYIKDRSAWVLDLKNNSQKIIYDASSNEKVTHIHWTPDGKYIYLISYDNYPLDFFTSNEKLIEVSSGKEVSFKENHHGFNTYTWK